MKKKWLKKGSAALLAVTMALSLFPGRKGTLATVQAAENTAPESGYWTDADGLKEFGLSSSSEKIGKIKFGLNGNASRLWAICGEDGNDLALLSTSMFGRGGYGDTSEYSSSYFVQNIKNYLDSNFSAGEQGKMAEVTVKTDEPYNPSIKVSNKKLYLPDSKDKSYGETVKTIYVGQENNVAIDLTKLTSDNGFGVDHFWLRSPYDDIDKMALGVKFLLSGVCVGTESIDYPYNEIVPAFNLNLSSDIFASAADAASSSYNGYKANDTMTANTYTLRYPSAGTERAVISVSGKKVTVTDAAGKYLMVQNNAGVYAYLITSDTEIVSASDIELGNDFDNFNNCKVWIESTDSDRITTAKLAKQATTIINSVAVTDIAAPTIGSALDTEADCATTGVSSPLPEVEWEPNDTTAGYGTAYTASVTLTADDDYEFADNVTATVNGENAASVTKNWDGTVTVTYKFDATAKAKLISITAPEGITVENGTACENMGLPESVAIVTEGNTETTAAVIWDRNTPESGSYDPSVLTEQSVTLKGTVICPSNINQGTVELTTTITVTISAAGIVGTPAFAPAAGTYTENQSVELSSSTEGAAIYYTTDGTTPTADSDVYSGPISVTGTAGQSIPTTIKAIAVKNGMQDSSVADAAYVIELPAPKTYAVTVNNGAGDGSYEEGETVTITADAAPEGQEFDKWTVVSGDVTLTDSTSATTTFAMPAEDVEITAAYRDKNGTLTLSGTVTVTGTGTAPDETYSFVATEDGEAAAEGKAEGAGSISFTEIAYGPEDLGEHTYVITQVPGSTEGMTYDDAAKTVVVEVSSGEGDELKVEIIGGDEISFENVYEAGEPDDEEDPDDEKDLDDEEAPDDEKAPDDEENPDDEEAPDKTEIENAVKDAVGKLEIPGGAAGDDIIRAIEDAVKGAVKEALGDSVNEDDIIVDTAGITVAEAAQEEDGRITGTVKVEINGETMEVSVDILIPKTGKEEEEPEACEEHRHEYEWTESREASEDRDAEEVYQCKYCGDIKYRLEIPNSAYAKFNKDAVTSIDRASAGAEVKIKTNLWVSFRKEVIEALKERPDVTVTVDYLYQGIPYTVTIPAGADLDALEESEGYYGFRYLDRVFEGRRIN